MIEGVDCVACEAYGFVDALRRIVAIRRRFEMDVDRAEGRCEVDAFPYLVEAVDLAERTLEDYRW